ncbi:MAG: hypothetical protein RR376_16175, partial [Janthinobacterium sp.]
MNTPDRQPGGALILVLNCGSSSIKFALFEESGGALPQQAEWSGKVEGIGRESASYRAGGLPAVALPLDPEQPHHAALEYIRAQVVAQLAGRPLRAVAHRVVHGGSKYFAPVRIDFAVLAERNGSVISAALFGALAGTGALPFSREQFEAAIRRAGVGVDSSLKAFGAGFDLAQNGPAP